MTTLPATINGSSPRGVSPHSNSHTIPRNGTILTHNELNRIRNSILPSTENNLRETKKQELKKLSAERVKNWPNTLEALRKKKESYLKEKEELEEIKRQEIDREEAELRRKTRIDAIERANNMIYEQTDQMKYLRSQELLSDVLYSRNYQLQEKKQRKENEKLKEKQHHEEILQQIQQEEEKEKLKLLQKQKKMNEISISRKEQLDYVLKIKQQEILEQQLIGKELKQKAIEQLEEEEKNKEKKLKFIEENNLKILESNKELKLIKQRLLDLENEEILKRENEINIIENRKLIRKALEIRKFEKAQKTRQQIIDAATKALEANNTREEIRLEKQINELKIKQDLIENNKIQQQEENWNKILLSRKEQITEKKLKKLKEKEEEEKLIEKLHEENEINNKKEREKLLKSKEMVIEIKKSQLAMATQRKKDQEEERLIQQLKDQTIENELKENDDKFRRICISEIERYRADGKPLLPLYRALEHKPPEIMAVTGFRL